MIRDKYYDSKTMLYIWNQMKKKTFKIPQNKAKKDNTEKQLNISLSRKEYIEMLKSMFKIMIGGLSNDRMTLMDKWKRKAEKKGQNPIFNIFKKLSEEIFDDTEYRLSLWLPLTQDQKLDMIMHQRIEEEMEIMIFMFDEELELSKSHNTKADLKIERALDSVIYEKYLQYAQLQATKKSLELCTQRVETSAQEDQQLIQYASFLNSKLQDYESLLTQMRQEVAKKRKHNDRQRDGLDDRRRRKFCEEQEKLQQELTQHKKQGGSMFADSSRHLRMNSGNSNANVKRKRFTGAGSIASGFRQSIREELDEESESRRSLSQGGRGGENNSSGGSSLRRGGKREDSKHNNSSGHESIGNNLKVKNYNQFSSQGSARHAQQRHQYKRSFSQSKRLPQDIQRQSSLLIKKMRRVEAAGIILNTEANEYSPVRKIHDNPNIKIERFPTKRLKKATQVIEEEEFPDF